MSERGEDIEDVLDGLSRSEERSPLFWWLHRHHDAIVRATGGRRMRWEPLRARVVARGLTDVRGKSPTLETLRKTWWSVRREIAKERRTRAEREAVPRKLQPARLPSTWRPTPVEPPQVPVTSRVAPAAAVAPVPAARPEMGERARAMLASLQDQLDYADRYVRPPKRKA